MIYFLVFIYLLVLLQAFLQLRPKQPRKAPSVSVMTMVIIAVTVSGGTEHPTI